MPAPKTVMRNAIKADMRACLPSHDERGKPILYLTFDDGPSSHTLDILELLGHFKAKATFFVVGKKLVRHWWVSLRALEQGHLVMNHSWDHSSIRLKSQAEVQADILATEMKLVQLYQEAGVERPAKLYRPPMGAMELATPGYIRSANAIPILWHVDTKDWAIKDDVGAIRDRLRTAMPGDVVLLHDGAGRTDAMEAALANTLWKFTRDQWRMETLGRWDEPEA